MGFLHHLAGMALGEKQASAAWPSLPSRFAASPFMGTSQGLQVIEQATPTMPTTSVQPEVVRSPQPRATPPASVAARSQHPPPRAEPHAAASQPVRQEVGSPPPPPAPSIVTVVEPRPSPENSYAVIDESPERPQPVPAAQRPAAPPSTKIQVLAKTQVTRAAPLSPAVVAGRVMAVREQAPVIHVTIDRLDVRAPARAEPARQRPRPQPTVSLSDYLRDGSSGGRR